MEGIVDIHNHILFGLDDGAKTLKESMDMIDDAYNQGVRELIFTPHYYPEVYDKELPMIRSVYELIRNKVDKKYPNMKLYLGNEILCVGDIVEQLNSKRINTLANSQYILVEFLVEIEYELLENKIKEFLLNGYIPIIAHCERYECLRTNINRIIHLVESGAYIQVNASSVYTLRNKRFVKKLIDADCLHFVASDAHDREKRCMYLKKSVTYLDKKYNEEYVRWLMVENPHKVIANQRI